MHIALDVNGIPLNLKDQALLLATPVRAMRISPKTDASKSATWIYERATILKITGTNRVVAHLDAIKDQTALFEIESVMLEKIT
jgi:hypothetical protein